ncbi:hypothetical protein F4808DRAFT_475445 [Astrocystis sublimbata]|nr:hypothetical protein F4808DRAFT_475445 [Astrocystis sublimbata]
MISIIGFTCLLELAVVVVHSISQRNFGLVVDNGSGVLQIGSKFTPTLLATIYVFLVSVLLDDVKRTEPFARLSSPGGAPANFSVHWTADAWWDALWGSLPLHGRKTSWAMLCAALSFILGFLVVSPLSSSLIVSQTIILTQEKHFAQLNTRPKMPLKAKPFSETYFRSIASILRNVSTSAWIRDDYTVIPFWPASINDAPLGPILPSGDETWKATTAVYSVDLNCEKLQTKHVSVPESSLSSITITLISQTGCEIRYTYGDDLYFIDGSIVWTAPTDTSNVSSSYSIRDGESNPAHCSQNEYYFAQVGDPEVNTTVVGEACRASYYTGDAVVTAKLINGQSTIQIDEQQYYTNRQPISPTTVDISTFQNASVSADWAIHLSAWEVVRYTRGLDNNVVGPGNLLAALYDFSPKLMAEESLDRRRDLIQRVKRRFFGELLRDCFDEAQAHNAIQIHPASATSMAKILPDDPGTIRSFSDMPAAAGSEDKAILSKYRYAFEEGKMRLLVPEARTGTHNTSDNTLKDGQTHPDAGSARSKKVRKSAVLGIASLATLLVTLTMVLIAILTLYIYSKGHKLYQKAFAYTVSVSVKGVDLGDVNPASILTTLVAIIIGLWWGSLDTNLRRTQPFLAMAKGPVIASKGASISYRSSYLLWASTRAAKRKHWVLFLVCNGTFLTQILTIAMSSLWSRQPEMISIPEQAPKALELRHVPIVVTGVLSTDPRGSDKRSTALSNLYGDLKASWIYGAVVQLSLNGPEPSWSSKGWNFVLVDLASTNTQNTSIRSTLQSLNSTHDFLTKATLNTSAIRGRLECTEYPFTDTAELWMSNWKLPADKKLDPDISHAYELNNELIIGEYFDTIIDDFGNSTTTLFTSDRRLQCCSNTTSDRNNQASIGYWSPNLAGTPYPHITNVWPANFTVKWIRGHAIEAKLSELDGTNVTADERVPINCVPVFETANASVTVDARNGRVEDMYAWTSDFLAYKQPGISETFTDVNMTTSHGILFILGLLGAADLENLIGATRIDDTEERLEEQTFNIREPGMNMDYMTYAMLSLVGKNHSALLDTFSTFFQHFVNNNINMTSGDIGEPVPEFSNDTKIIPKKVTPIIISQPMEVLSMSEPAAWLCIVILFYLIITSVLLAIAARRYNRLLLRPVNSIADIAYLVAGSHDLLKVAKERSLESLKHDYTIKAKLDWFTTNQGDRRWGIELVDKPDSTASRTPSRESDATLISSDNSAAEEEASWYDTTVSEIMAIGV